MTQLSAPIGPLGTKLAGDERRAGIRLGEESIRHRAVLFLVYAAQVKYLWKKKRHTFKVKLFKYKFKFRNFLILSFRPLNGPRSAKAEARSGDMHWGLLNRWAETNIIITGNKIYAKISPGKHSFILYAS